jgi:hypothetical protein
MSGIIMPAFHAYKDEAAIIGRLLAGYGELEFLLCHCLGVVAGNLSTACRIVFRNRGEEGRISTADAILRPHYEQHNLIEAWDLVRRNLQECKAIRNQYSHCNWLNDPNGLFFTNLEKGAKSLTGNITQQFCHLDVPVLSQQEDYFRSTGDGLCYLREEHRVRIGKIQNHPWPAPGETPPPPRHNPPGKHRIQTQAEFHERLRQETAQKNQQ